MRVDAQEAPTSTRRDVVRGHVTDADDRPLRGAAVVVTVVPSTATLAVATDSLGAYRVRIERGAGEYLLYVSAAGRRGVRRRVTLTGADSVATVDVRLASGLQGLDVVRIVESKARPRPWAIDDRGAFGGGRAGDKLADGVVGLVTPDQEGSIAALAATVPGIAVTAGGLSAFGAAPDQTRTTLNGLTFGGDALPRDATTSVRVQSSPWDPALGGFGGALVATSVAQGGRSATRRARVTLDAPPLQFSGAGAPQLGQEYGNVTASAGGTGALVPDQLYHNFGAQLSQRWSPAAHLDDVDADALARSGIAADSARRLLDLLRLRGIPVRGSGVPNDRLTTRASFVERVDRYDWLPLGQPEPAIPHPSWWLTALGSLTRSDAPGSGPTSAPGTGGRSTSGDAALLGEYRAFVGPSRTLLSETKGGLSYTASRGTPYLALPGAIVLVASTLADGTTGLGAFRAGGNDALARDASRWSTEVTNQTAFVVGGHLDHPFQLSLQSRYEAYDESAAGDRLGTFQYLSLADFAANRPAIYTRTLGARPRRGGAWTGAAALGVDWAWKFRDVGTFRLNGGLRADAQRFARPPAANPAIAQAFGARTDAVPDGMDVSPRLGVSWIRHNRGASVWGTPISSANAGQSTLSLGAGLFRALLPTTLLGDAARATGLGGTRRLACVGPAVPIPDWAALAAGTAAPPPTCAGAGAMFADSAPAVQLFAPGYRAPRNWRTELGWSDAIFRVYFTLAATLAWNRAQPSTVDLNFAARPRFTLADEGGRSVFASPSDVVPASGVVAAGAARLVPAYGRVVERRSDLRADARQLALWATRDGPHGPAFWSVGYTLADVHAEARGFDGLAGDEPRTIERGRGPYTPRHTWHLQLGRQMGPVSVTASGRAISGLPFTPIVAGDVNGDGVPGDRAFVFDPARVADPALAAGLRTLLADAPRATRDCLRREIGRVAARDACTGPWSATLNASLLGHARLPTRARVATLQLSFDNVIGGLDQALHGSRLRGWGGPPLPDAVLYRVQGFDPFAQRFAYAVNPRFGVRPPATSAQVTPFRIALDVRLDLREPSESQVLGRALHSTHLFGRGRPPADVVADRLVRENLMDVYAMVLRRADALGLTSEQTERLARGRQRLHERIDSLYADVAATLVALPPQPDRAAATRRLQDANARAWAMTLEERHAIADALTFPQIQALPELLVAYITGDRTTRFYLY